MLTNWLMNEVQQAMVAATFPCGAVLSDTTLSGVLGYGNDPKPSLDENPQSLGFRNHPQIPHR